MDTGTITVAGAVAVTIIGALAAGIVKVILALRETHDMVIKSHAQNEALIQKADHIEKLTNSNLSKVTADLAIANDRIQVLQALVGKLLAATSASASEPPP